MDVDAGAPQHSGAGVHAAEHAAAALKSCADKQTEAEAERAGFHSARGRAATSLAPVCLDQLTH